MDWDGLRVFLAVARAGRVSAAARRLGVEHTTVSRRLASLERELGAALFYRTARGYLVTAHGEAVRAQAETMERAAQAIDVRAEQDAPVAGRVRLAMIEDYASAWLGPALPAFRSQYPGIELEIVVGVSQLDLSRGEADLAMRVPRPHQTGLAATRLGHTSFALYAARSLLGKRRLRVTGPGTLGELPLLVYAAAYHRLQGAAWFQPVLAGARIALISNSTYSLLAAAQAGAGVAVLPHLIARGSHDLIGVSDDVSRQEAWLVTHPELRRDPKVRAVAGFLKQLAAATAHRL